ncbi:MAG: hypothetical protein J1F23_00990 [Oscillospiraceae bacterium]|nr:hypothetical protein [Oscillospiraceae bacterium]
MQQNTQANRNTEFLNKIYKNSAAGSESISFIKEKVDDKNLLNDLQYQHMEYQNIQNRASTELSKLGEVPKEQTPFAELGMWSGIQMNTILDKSPDKIAEMMIQGSTMGIIDMVRTIKQFPDVPQASKQIGEDLIKLEENSMQKMKQYLA